MKAKPNIDPAFRPFSIEIEFESIDEARAFRELFNYSPVTSIFGETGGESIRDAIDRAAGECLSCSAMFVRVRDHIRAREKGTRGA